MRDGGASRTLSRPCFERKPTVTDVVILFDASCPNVDTARERVASALNQVSQTTRWRELDVGDPRTPAQWRGFASPTVLVDGRDVAAGSSGHSACRLYRDADGRLDVAPTVESIVAAIQQARTGSRGATALGAGAASAAVLVAFTWACCLPIFAALGVGAFALGAAIEPWRMPLSVAAVALLGLGIWRERRARRCGCKRRRSTMIVLSLAALATAFALGLPWLASWWARFPS
jgi:mercuric ion transport protein